MRLALGHDELSRSGGRVVVGEEVLRDLSAEGTFLRIRGERCESFVRGGRRAEDIGVSCYIRGGRGVSL